MVAKDDARRSIPAIRVRQWLKGWDKVDFSSRAHRSKPPQQFYLFSLPAAELRSLCGIARRKTSGLTPRAADLGIQREHDPDRSSEIARFVEYGYPWSTLSEAKRRSAEFNDLRKPGWLPTAVVINILRSVDKRENEKVAHNDLVEVIDRGEISRINLPYGKWSKAWEPTDVAPLEVIDGQHRLWAFDSYSDPEFELPVVAFHGLDISWQAYLFWTINIKPKRINASLAFDLYPLLRAEDWLDREEGHVVYRETRSQELTEALWSHTTSPWYDKINMLGERGIPWVSQAAWIRSLMATFVRRWQGGRNRPGGLFGSRIEGDIEVLAWSRAQQAAFLIYAWQQFYTAVHQSKSEWAKHLRSIAVRQRTPEEIGDPAFYGPYSLINTDQGVRGYLNVVNDLCFTVAPKLDLRSWRIERQSSASDENAVTLALNSLSKHRLATFVKRIAQELESFDWRTSSTPDLTDKERLQASVYRGSGGYKELRSQLLEFLARRDGDLGKAATLLRERDKS
jgi:DGQHR domain-containing protein